MGVSISNLSSLEEWCLSESLSSIVVVVIVAIIIAPDSQLNEIHAQVHGSDPHEQLLFGLQNFNACLYN